LETLTAGAKGSANLLDLSIKAARARCTLGEISYALESVFGRHVPVSRVASGSYKSEFGNHADISNTIELCKV
jgi:methylmalonyl-CoA mutase